jgi:5-hydroxyisourate hydrolase
MISTHVLDTSRGRPAANVAVTLERQQSGEWRPLARTATDADGRARELTSQPPPGIYRLTFDVAGYFSALGQEHFYPSVSVVFQIKAAGERHHVPLLISPFGYSTYRGS